jgi:hypothetical protein
MVRCLQGNRSVSLRYFYLGLGHKSPGLRHHKCLWISEKLIKGLSFVSRMPLGTTRNHGEPLDGTCQCRSPSIQAFTSEAAVVVHGVWYPDPHRGPGAGEIWHLEHWAEFPWLAKGRDRNVWPERQCRASSS